MTNHVQTIVYIGTYTEPLPHVAGRGEGIYRCRFEASNGVLTPLDCTPGIANPSYLAVAPDRSTLYAVQETNKDTNPAVFALAIEPESGELRILNQQPVPGGLPWAHYGIRTQEYKLIFFYGLPLDASGALPDPTPASWELYDLGKDPQELNNVYHDPAYTEVVAQLKAELLALKQELGDEDEKYPELMARL